MRARTAWCDALSTDAAKLQKCVALPDSGFFIDYQSAAAAPRAAGPSAALERAARRLNTSPGAYHAGLQWVFETHNASAGVNTDCVAAKGTGVGDYPPYLCMFAEHTAVFTHTPIFALQSEYDSWQTSYVLNPADGPQAPQLLGNNMTKRMHADLFGPHPVRFT